MVFNGRIMSSLYNFEQLLRPPGACGAWKGVKNI
jgi:hypothetical protein